MLRNQVRREGEKELSQIERVYIWARQNYIYHRDESDNNGEKRVGGERGKQFIFILCEIKKNWNGARQVEGQPAKPYT